MCKLLRLRGLQKLTLLMFAMAAIPGKSDAQTPTYAYNPSTQVADTVSLASNMYNDAQYLYAPADISPATPASGGFISRIYIKAGSASASGGIFTNLNIKMMNSSLTTLTGTTWQTGLSTAYAKLSDTINSWTNSGWIPYTLQTPLAWNGTSNILIEISQTGMTTPLPLMHGTISGRNGRTYGNTSSSTTQANDAQLLVFGFDLSCNGTPDNPTITTTPMVAGTTVCSGGTKNLVATYPSSSVSLGIAYQWEQSASAAGPWTPVTGGTGATTLNYTTAALTSSTYFRLAATCVNSSLTDYSKDYLVTVGTPQPGIITASAGTCPGDTVTFTVPNVAGTTYAWVLPGGWVGSSTSNTISVAIGTGTGPVAVTATSSCGATSIARNLTPATGNPPSAPGSIFGLNLVCPGTTQTYSVLPVPGARSYNWSLPTGWIGSSTTNSITVTAGTVSGNIVAYSVNGCGQSVPSAPLAVTALSSLANPGVITGVDTACSGTLQVYSVAPVPGATSYNWILPSGWSGTTTTNSIQTFPGAGTGNVRVTATATCATSSSSSKSVVVIPTLTPGVSISSSASSICEHVPVTFTATAVSAGTNPLYQWKKNGSNISGATGLTYTDNHIIGSDVITIEMRANNRCQSGSVANSNALSLSVTPAVLPGVSINTMLPVSICEGTPVTFSTISNGAGASPSYQWYKNGLQIASANGSTYTDATLQNGDTVSVEMISSATCISAPLVSSNKVGLQVDSIVTPDVMVSVSPSEVVLPGATYTFTATHVHGGATPGFQWQKNGVDIAFENGDTYVGSNLKIGDHISVRMQSYENCVTASVVNSNTIVMKSSVGVSGLQTLAALSLYPNPNNGRFTLAAKGWEASLIGQQLRIDVLSSLGQSVYHVELSPSSADWKTQVDLGNGLANGQYMLRVSTADGAFRSTMPFVLNR